MSACGRMAPIAVTWFWHQFRGQKNPGQCSLMSRPPYKRYGNMPDLFQVEELFLDSKSGAFELEDSRPSSAEALERLYLVAAIAILYGTTQGMAVQIAGLRQQVDPKKATRHQLFS